MNDNYLVRQLLGSVRRSALFIVFVAIFLNIGIGVSWFTITRLEERTPKYIPSRANVPIEQDDLNDPIGIQSQKLTVNAQLQVNGQFYLAPSTLPADAKAGTIVFDQATNSLQYYDGNDFTQVASQKAVEALPQVAVTSLQGQTGAITLTPGPGIALNGTTISNSGLLGINGVAGSINVTTANGIASISLPQAIDPNATPTFNSINLSAPLPVTSGGTGVNNFNQYSLLVGNGTGPLTVTAAAGSAGLCLISNNLAAPSFQACPGGVGGTAVTATTPGTANRIAKFTAGTDIGDSSITDNGSLVSVGAPVTINGGVTTTGIFSVGTLDITPGSALTVGAINQQFTLQGSSTSTITARSGSNTTTLDFQTPTSNSTITFPTEAGVVCLRNSTNCGFSTTGSGVSSVNTLTGAVTIQGTTNQVGVTVVTVGSNIVLSTPQDIGTSSNVQFNNLTLTGNLTVGTASTLFANNITQTAAGQAITLTAGADGITFNANGRSFILPTTGGVNQTICTTGISCVAGGGQAVLLAPGASAQTDNSTDSSLFIDKTNGTGNILQLQKNGSDVAVLGNNGTFNINTITPISGNFTLGNTANNTIVQGTTSSEFRIGSVTYRFKPDAPIGTYTICTSEGNCSGLTGAVTTSGGTNGRLPKFTGSQAISDSILSESGSVITANNGSLVLQGSAGLTLGVSGGSGATGRVDFKNTTNSNTVTLQSGITSVASLTFTLPAADGGSNQCIKTNGSGVLGFGDCLSGSGGGGGVTALNGVSGSVTLQGSSANRVTVSGAGPIVIDLPQDIATTSAVNFGTLSLAGTASAGLSIGSAGSAGRIVLNDGGVTPRTVTLLTATLTGANKTITIPNFTGTTATLPVTASGNVAVDSNGNIALTGTIPVGSGGTGGTTQAAARSGIGAAAAGANSDITSTSVLNTITPSGSLMVGATGQSFTLQGNAASVITATNGSFATTVGFTGTPTAAVRYNFDQAAAAGTYAICTTTGNCLGGGAGGANTTLSNLGTVALNSDLLPSAAGARNLGSAALPFGNLYIGAAATNNFRITGTASSARTITIPDATGTLAVSASGNIALSAAGNISFSGTLAVGSGGTGATSFTSNGVLYGNVSGSLQVTAPGTNNQCLLGNTGSAPTWGACPGDGAGVTTVGAFSGSSQANGATIAGSTITFGPADASNPGMVTTGTQSIAGAKTFNAGLIAGAGITTNAGLTASSGGSIATNRGTDYSTTGISNNAAFGSAGLYRLIGGSTQTITGIAGGVDGRQLVLVNAAAQAAVISNNNGSSLAANRIITGTGTDVTLASGASISLIYDSGASLWRVSGAAAGSYGTLQQSYDADPDGSDAVINLSSTDGALIVRDAASPLAKAFAVQTNGGFDLLSVSSTAVTLQDSSGNNALIFDSTSSELRVYENVASPTRYLRMYYDTANNVAVYSASTGATQIGSGTGSGGDINFILNGAENDKFTGTKSFSVTGNYLGTDFNFVRNLTGSSFNLGGNIAKIEDLSSATSGTISPNVLYINQNNASATGNLILAQTGGAVDRFRVSTTGTVTIAAGASYTSTGALTVASAINTDLTLTAAGTGRIVLGASDTTGTPLVLDTKTSLGDPTGVAGAMYYNSNLGTFRCYEGTAWRNCLNGVIRATADRATTSTSLVTIPDLSYAVAANTSYSFKCNLTFMSDNATNGFAFSINGPSSPTMIDYTTSYQTTANNTATTSLFTQRHDTAYNAMPVTASVVNASTNLAASIEGTLTNGATAGTLSVTFASELGTQTVTIKSGSSCTIW